MGLAQAKDDLSKYLRLAAYEEIVITRHGRPAGVLIEFASDDDWFEYRLEHHPKFIERVAKARVAIREGRGILLDEAKTILNVLEQLATNAAGELGEKVPIDRDHL